MGWAGLGWGEVWWGVETVGAKREDGDQKIARMGHGHGVHWCGFVSVVTGLGEGRWRRDREVG